ncbi:MAG TPA: bifunctional folylpolyglutamate synthase/dihydrofolate synthase [Alphaproteobacteria bacterium]|nr:bifunctional folylpolyglutamate synthase/dihydrofolate synthase [Alphaproteobacteria bacterium]
MSRTDAILGRLLALHPKLIDLHLERELALLDKLGNPHRRLPPVIHVAGTNGKGSTVAYLRAFLEAAGQRVHVYTSPQLVRFNERIRLAGRLVSNRELNEALETCEAVNAGQPITYFEITTAAAFLLFSQVPADYLLLEVGLGGRYDATNVVDHPLGTIITPVSIDHVEYLGNTVARIAHEKAGILKRGAPAAIGLQTEEGLGAIEKEARRLGITPIVAGRDFDGCAEHGRMVFQDAHGLIDLPRPALAGPHQIDNATLAIAAARHFHLPVGEAEIAQGLRTVDWPARLMPLDRGRLVQLLSPGQELWLDGGHNEAGGRVLAEALRELDRKQKRPLVLIMGTFANKDAAGYLGHFGDLPRQVYTVPIPGDRAAWPAHTLADLARSLGLEAEPRRSVAGALRAAAAIPRARIVICGSLHLAGHVLDRNGTPPQ